MKKLLFVDHSYHAKTGATRFLQELLARHFALEVLWDEGWSGKGRLGAKALNARQADAILFFQAMPAARILRRLRCSNIIWAPMRDGLRYSSSRLARLGNAPIKVLNFCQEAHAFFSSRGQESFAAQYWPAPEPVREVRHAAPQIFFWPRRREITWNTLKILLGAFRPRGIVLRYAQDPGHDVPLPGADDIREYNITVVQGWLPREAYLAQLRESDIFVAPRPLEGIGQAALEAMSHGLAVIAPDAPTMNEYLRDGHSGWLYPLSKPAPLDFSGWAERGAAARAAVSEGHRHWLAQEDAVADFVGRPVLCPASMSWRLLRALHL